MLIIYYIDLFDTYEGHHNKTLYIIMIYNVLKAYWMSILNQRDNSQ